METSVNEIISATQNWIEQVVIDLNFCPFAAKPYKSGAINYKVIQSALTKNILIALMQECYRLNEDFATETSLLILPQGFADFQKYLELVDISEQLMKKEGFEGIYQLASFHPRYIFAGSHENDPTNYTNRALFPMLHILREDLLEEAIKKHKDVGLIPEKNMAKANQLGLLFFKSLKF